MEEKIIKVLREASRFKRFPVTEANLKSFVGFIWEKQPIDLWNYLRYSDEYARVGLSLLYALQKHKFIVIDKKGKLYLSVQGKKLVKHLKLKKTPKAFKQLPVKFGLKLSPKFQNILKTMKKLYAKVSPQNRFDQAPLTPEAGVYKAAYIALRGDLTNRNVVCVGDDDMLSIMFALTNATNKVLAVDIDKYLLETIEEYADKHKLNIETVNMDLRKPVPKEFASNYDTFVTEPPDTVNGISLFVSRGVELLKKQPDMVGYCGISVTACPRLGLLKMDENFHKMGLQIAERVFKFDEYPPHRTELKHVEVPDCYDAFYPPKKVWYVSDLTRFKTTEKTKPLFKGRFKGTLANYKQDAVNFQ